MGRKMSRTPTEFGSFLLEMIQRNGYTMTSWAESVDEDTARISDIYGGRRTPPPELLDRWADSLALSDAERKWFKDLALLVHTKDPALRARLFGLLKGARALEAQSRVAESGDYDPKK